MREDSDVGSVTAARDAASIEDMMFQELKLTTRRSSYSHLMEDLSTTASGGNDANRLLDSDIKPQMV